MILSGVDHRNLNDKTEAWSGTLIRLWLNILAVTSGTKAGPAKKGGGTVEGQKQIYHHQHWTAETELETPYRVFSKIWGNKKLQKHSLWKDCLEYFLLRLGEYGWLWDGQAFLLAELQKFYKLSWGYLTASSLTWPVCKFVLSEIHLKLHFDFLAMPKTVDLMHWHV